MTSLILEGLRTEKIIRPTYYASIDPETLSIVGISPHVPSSNSNLLIMQIEYDLAIRFLDGKENITLWTGVYDGENLKIVRVDHKPLEIDRIETLKIVEVVGDVRHPDIRIVYQEKKRQIEIHYNGETLSACKVPVKLYFTAEGNPSYLKYAFTLDLNILNQITSHNGLEEWPNPIILPIDIDDGISVYTVKSNLKMAIQRQ